VVVATGDGPQIGLEGGRLLEELRLTIPGRQEAVAADDRLLARQDQGDVVGDEAANGCQVVLPAGVE
jgi:hypothetical protein